MQQYRQLSKLLPAAAVSKVQPYRWPTIPRKMLPPAANPTKLTGTHPHPEDDAFFAKDFALIVPAQALALGNSDLLASTVYTINAH